ncbi:thioesterase II family protein [Streptomyces sp. NBC_00503]|uniref:thioesterase II family protein n=1 Tax=Streptomyces sp. NBC_00503 TaxID=2903659 RepID=UPI002E815DBD|nr:alpha/beta fold hydrolase [Streptomyces sp. NBC_00503]WUD84368.1 alpha/beta fold hydrolase [Streptomyces sp. NBC_00503]
MTLLEIPELAPETPYIWRARRPGATRRLICFPHAGAGAPAYADWVDLLPPEIELVAVQLPGRQDRLAEDPFTEVGPLVEVLTHALRPVLDGSYVFFGHSAGATLAYELARALQARGSRGPEHLFLSAQPAPGESEVRLLHELSDEEFRAEIVALGGIDEEIAEDDDVMESMLYTVRADFTLWERHRSEPGAPLDCPVTVLCGESDPRAPLDEVKRWADHTTAEFAAEFFPGGHFYFFESASEVVSLIGRKILTPATNRRSA